MVHQARTHGSSFLLAKRTLECFDPAPREGRGNADRAYRAYWKWVASSSAGKNSERLRLA
jgi:hypothetical protein